MSNIYRREFEKTATAQRKKTETAAVTSATQAGNAASRQAAYVSQVNAILEAASVARSKGVETNGKIVGVQAIATAYESGTGASIPDIGEELNLEADELDPNLIRAVGEQEKHVAENEQVVEQTPPEITPERTAQAEVTSAPVQSEEERERKIRPPVIDFDLEL